MSFQSEFQSPRFHSCSAGIRQDVAGRQSRQPDEIELIVRGNVELTDRPGDNGRGDFTGSLEQVAADIAATRSMGAAELLFDVQFSPEVKGTDDILKRLEQLRQAAGG